MSALEAHLRLIASLNVRTHHIEPAEVKESTPAAERARRWRLENPEKEKATKRRYREANRERLREYFRAYREKNRERVRAIERRYYERKRA